MFCSSAMAAAYVMAAHGSLAQPGEPDRRCWGEGSQQGPFGKVLGMLSRAVLCPSPPLLARDLTGRADVLPELRAACAAAVERLLAARTDLVAVIGPGDATATWNPASQPDLREYADSAPGGTPGLPLAVGLGAMLLDEAGYEGPRELH